MKSWNKNSLYLKWFFLSVIITLCCVAVGAYTTHQIREAERLRDQEDRQRRINELKGPEQAYFKIIQELSQSGKYTVDEAYRVIKGAHENHPFIATYLMDDKGQVIDSSFNAPKLTDKNTPQKISKNRSVVFVPKMHRPLLDHRRPSKSAFVTGAVTAIFSIIAGLGISVLMMSMYLRRRSKEAEMVIEKLKSGDLKARFEIKHNDETNQLMWNFNEIASQIEGLVENLRKTESTRTRLLQELAHDLRTPVASLKNLQETLLEKGHLLSEEKKNHVQNLAIKEILYFERLVEDLLFLSGVNDPRFTQSFSKVDLSELLLVEGELFQTDKIRIKFDIGEHLVIHGDEHLLRRLIKNALSNATRFAKSEVLISLKNKENLAAMKIIDDGKGLSADELVSFGEKKFSRKYLDSNSDHISIGLGSVIMKKIIDLHEGQMNIQNNTQRNGCELSFSLPI